MWWILKRKWPRVYCVMSSVISIVSCQKGPTRDDYAWQIGPFWPDTLDICQAMSILHKIYAAMWIQLVMDRISLFDYFVQDCCISIANALEIQQSCTKPSVCCRLCSWHLQLLILHADHVFPCCHVPKAGFSCNWEKWEKALILIMLFMAWKKSGRLFAMGYNFC